MSDTYEDYGRKRFREIGKLSSMLPAYVRHCCRSLHDGTDDDVLDAFRETAYKVLLNYTDDYKFVKPHLETLRIYSPEMVKELIIEHSKDVEGHNLGCMATSSTIGLPKRACLHCPKIGQWMKVMEKAGKMNDEGVRNGYK